jgi:hypothetical protein
MRETYQENFAPQLDDVRASTALSLSMLLRFGIAVLTISLMVGGGLPQLEMALFNGNIPIPTSYDAYLLCMLLGVAVLLETKFSRGGLALPIFLLVAFLLLDAIHLFFNEDVAATEVIHTYMGFYMTLIIGAGVTMLHVRMNERLLTSLIIVVFAISVVISAMQVITNSPVLPTQSNDQTWVVSSDMFLGGQSQRAFGLFSSGLGLGLFCSFVGALGASYCRTWKGSLIGLPLLAASAFGCYATLTRVAMIDLICCVVTVFVFSRRHWRRAAIWLPLVWALVALITVAQAVTGAGNRSENLANTDSVNVRFQEWEASILTFASATPAEQILGQGIAPGNSNQSGAVQPAKRFPFPIDNITIALLSYVGALGVIVTGFFFVIAWLYVYRRAISGGSHLQIAVAAFWSTILFAGSFNVTLGPLGALLLVSALCEPKHSERPIQLSR